MRGRWHMYVLDNTPHFHLQPGPATRHRHSDLEVRRMDLLVRRPCPTILYARGSVVHQDYRLVGLGCEGEVVLLRGQLPVDSGQEG